ncbi:hypothetical protein MMC20_003203 [Loxospora ochrophaea]|nr:hypothetical protein [Loxospora ochrophaea]
MEDDPNGNRFAVDMDLLRNGGNDIRVEIILENGDVEGLNSNEDGSSTDGNSSVDAMCIGSEGSEGSEGSCSISSVKAVSMQITAQSVKELFGAISYTTVDGGLSRCTGCSSLVQNPSPKMAQHFVLGAQERVLLCKRLKRHNLIQASAGFASIINSPPKTEWSKA